MKKIKSQNIVDYLSIKRALEKDVDLICNHTNYESFDANETLNIICYLGLESFPNLKEELLQLKSQQIKKEQPISFFNRAKLFFMGGRYD